MDDPQIVWMDNETWGKCPDCDDTELQQTTAVDGSGVYHDCGDCGNLWWEGEFVQPEQEAQ